MQLNMPPMAVRSSDTRARTAKADVRKADTEGYYASLGACIREVQHVSGLTLKEFCAAVGKDERQMARQIEGTDRPQLEAVFAVEQFRGPLVIALARLTSNVDVVTEIRVRRSA